MVRGMQRGNAIQDIVAADEGGSSTSGRGDGKLLPPSSLMSAQHRADDEERNGDKRFQEWRLCSLPVHDDKDQRNEGNKNVAKPPKDRSPKSQNQELDSKNERNN